VAGCHTRGGRRWIDTPPRRDLEERSETLLIKVVDAWLSSGIPLRFTRGIYELTEAAGPS